MPVYLVWEAVDEVELAAGYTTSDSAGPDTLSESRSSTAENEKETEETKETSPLEQHVSELSKLSCEKFGQLRIMEAEY